MGILSRAWPPVIWLASFLFPTVPAVSVRAGATDTLAVPPHTHSPHAVVSRLGEIAKLSQVDEREAALDTLWNELVEQECVPVVRGDTAVFLYRGEATSIRFVGDFNGWNRNGPTATRLNPLDIWIFEQHFPPDARLDYKIIRNDTEWLLDPVNPKLQRGGFGDNSVIYMPDYEPSPYVVRRPTVRRGKLVSEKIMSSALGQTIHYQVYLPPDYEALHDLPTLYVTDGHEYALDEMGSMPIVLDNLLDEKRLRPLIVVFIDPRVGSQNLRREHLGLNPAFLRFVTTELVPYIDTHYATAPERSARGILGTSLGGLNAAYFAVEATDFFYNIGIQSPAFQYMHGAIYERFRSSPRLDLDLYMTWGTFHDFSEPSMHMKGLLDEKGYKYVLRVVNEGHSWGAWRAQIAPMLMHFWGAP